MQYTILFLQQSLQHIEFICFIQVFSEITKLSQIQNKLFQDHPLS